MNKSTVMASVESVNQTIKKICENNYKISVKNVPRAEWLSHCSDCYGLDGPGIESRWGTKFSAPDQTGPGAHPTYCTMGAGSFPRVESG
jgi:hypothetical protein